MTFTVGRRSRFEENFLKPGVRLSDHFAEADNEPY